MTMDDWKGHVTEMPTKSSRTALEHTAVVNDPGTGNHNWDRVNCCLFR